MTNKKEAFTLIELLVVVLIIGILTAVAVPQYQKAVEKTRATEAMFILKSIRELQDVYFLTHGTYTQNLTDLDIKIKNPKGFRVFIGSCSVYAYNDNKRYGIYYYLPSSRTGSECGAKKGTEISCGTEASANETKTWEYVKKICTALGAKGSLPRMQIQ